MFFFFISKILISKYYTNWKFKQWLQCVLCHHFFISLNYQCAWGGPKEMNQTYSEQFSPFFWVHILLVSRPVQKPFPSHKDTCLCQAKKQAHMKLVPRLCLQALPFLGNRLFCLLLVPSTGCSRTSCGVSKLFDKGHWSPVRFLLQCSNFSTLPLVRRISASHTEIHKLWNFWN